MAKVRSHMIASGRVQGVGFRFSTKRLAKKYQVSGWVKNLPDNTVEIEVEGDEEKVKQFIEVIKANPNRIARVDDLELNLSEKLKNYQSFKTL